MNNTQVAMAIIVWLSCVVFTYNATGWRNIAECYAMFFTRSYWTDYNIIEFASWFCKAIIIIPGLIFGIQIWQLYFLTLFTSLTLIWASNKKLLPTLVAFNTMWAWLSIMVIFKNVFTGN